MKLSWKLIAAFYFPLHFAFGSFYVASLVLGDQEDCRNSCVISGNCADQKTMLILDFFGFAGIGLIALAFVLPWIILYRQKKMVQTSIFD